MTPAWPGSGGRTALADLLGSPPPPGISALNAEAQDRLVELLQRARDAQRHALDEAIDNGLGHLPRLLRPTVRLLIFG